MKNFAKTCSHYFIYAIVRTLGFVPFRLLYFIGWLLGHAYYLIGRRDQHITRCNVKTCLGDLNAAEQQKIIKQSMVHTAINAMETMWIWAHNYQHVYKKIVRYENLALLTSCEQDERGTIILAGHIGSWEVLTDVVAYYCQRPIYLGKLSGIKIFDDYIKKGREQSGGELLPTTRAGLESLIAANKAGRITGLLCDQTPSPKNGVYAPFFGKTALSSVFAQNLYQQTHANVILAWALRAPKGRGFIVKFAKAPADFVNSDLQLATTALNQAYEQLILDCPEQYVWNYRRFTHMPEGEADIYK